MPLFYLKNKEKLLYYLIKDGNIIYVSIGCLKIMEVENDKTTINRCNGCKIWIN